MQPPPSPPTNALVTAAEISRLAGVTRATVSNWRRRHEDFPSPVGGTDTSPAYDLAQVRDWLGARGRLLVNTAVNDLRLALGTFPGALSPPELSALLHLALQPTESLTALAALSDDDLPAAAAAADQHPSSLPCLDGTSLGPPHVPLLRALLRCVREQGSLAAIDVLDHGTGTGTVPTPPTESRGLADLMAALLTEPHGSYPESVLDPACGSGGLLMAAARQGARSLHGRSETATSTLCATARILTENPQATVDLAVGDGLRTVPEPDIVYHAALCNPPFGDRDWGHDDLVYDPRWAYGVPPRNESELAWVQHCLAQLRLGARAVLLMPPGAAERHSGRRIRAELLRQGALRTVVALPAGIHPPWHLSLHLWILRRPVPDTDPPRTVQFVDVTETSSTVVPHSDSYLEGLLHSLLWAAGRLPPGPRTLAERLLALRPDQSESGEDRGDDRRPAPLPARDVPVTELLDDTVDLTPARRIGVAAHCRHPGEQAVAARELLEGLEQALTRARSATARVNAVPAGDRPRRWRTATVADLLRGGALTLLRSSPQDPVRVEPGDVLVPEILREDGEAVRVVATEEIQQPLTSRTLVLRPDPRRLDPWFVAGFCSAEPNLRAVSSSLRASGARTAHLRPDVRRMRIPLMPLPEQQEYGRQFEQLKALTSAITSAADLAQQTSRSLRGALASGTLLPGDGHAAGSSPR